MIMGMKIIQPVLSLWDIGISLDSNMLLSNPNWIQLLCNSIYTTDTQQQSVRAVAHRVAGAVRFELLQRVRGGDQCLLGDSITEVK